MLAVLAALAAGAAGQKTTYDGNLPLHPADWEALHQFKAAITNDQKLLKTWTNDTHPCDWEGVDCDCWKLYPLPPDPYPCPDAPHDEFNFVYRLDFGPRKPSNKRLHGTYSPYLGNMSEVRQFYLHVNKFGGSIPPEFGNLVKLQRLIIRDNVLEGTLPPELGRQNIKDLYFDNNNIHGSIPEAWCNLVEREDSILNVVQPSNNPFLCGEVPACLYGKYLNKLHVVGTYLIYPPANDSATRVSGHCSDRPPTCERPDCFVDAPQVISNLRTFNFSFTRFTDELGMRGYEWGLGTAPGVCDAQLLQPFDLTSDGALNNGTYASKGVSLTNGQKYYVTVVGTNMAGPPLSINASSRAIVVDNTPPEPSKVLPLERCTEEAPAKDQDDRATFNLCWDEFIEKETSVVAYEVALESRDGKRVVDFQKVDRSARSHAFTSLALAPGSDYVGVVRAVNLAGRSGVGRTLPVRIREDSAEDLRWIIIIAVLIPVLLGSIGIFAVYVRVHRLYAESVEANNRRIKHTECLKELRHDLGVADSSRAGNLTDTNTALANAASIFFVITDLQDSTPLSQANPDGYQIIQDIHDALIRQGIDEFRGYEINTQGDSFELAFTSAATAVAFCIEIQQRLARVSWPEQVLEMNGCEREFTENGYLVHAGPRIRMAIHKAREGHYKRKIHDMTKHLVFFGEDFEIARNVSDSAYGGQILCTEEAVLCTLKEMDAAGYPTFECIGEFNIVHRNHVLYQAFPPWGSLKPWRSFPPILRKAKRLTSDPPTLHVVPPPMISETGLLTLVAIRVDGTSAGAEELVNELIASSAQYTHGYIAHSSEESGGAVYRVVFAETALATRFAALLQASFLYADWGSVLENFKTDDDLAPKYDMQGNMIWRGLRAAVSIFAHPTITIAANVATPQKSNDAHVIDLGKKRPTVQGWGVHAALAVLRGLHGGQSVLNHVAWSEVQDCLPSRSAFLSLGEMKFPGCDERYTLIQLLPNFLQERTFPTVVCGQVLSPGYDDSPVPSEGVAIAFAKCPLDDIEGVTDDERDAALLEWSKLCRELIARFNGYECKEPDPGKFTIAFTSYEDAAAFGAVSQSELRFRSKSWMPSSVASSVGKDYLPVQIGMAYGKQLFRKPLAATGRADYFGIIPNLAARVMGQAHPGQTVICRMADEVMEFAKVKEGRGVFEHQGTSIKLREVGCAKLKGIDFAPMLISVSTANFEDEFGKPKGWVSNSLEAAKAKIGDTAYEKLFAATMQDDSSASPKSSFTRSLTTDFASFDGSFKSGVGSFFYPRSKGTTRGSVITDANALPSRVSSSTGRAVPLLPSRGSSRSLNNLLDMSGK